MVVKKIDPVSKRLCLEKFQRRWIMTKEKKFMFTAKCLLDCCHISEGTASKYKQFIAYTFANVNNDSPFLLLRSFVTYKYRN
jgi:hypothetical protein